MSLRTPENSAIQKLSIIIIITIHSTVQLKVTFCVCLNTFIVFPCEMFGVTESSKTGMTMLREKVVPKHILLQLRIKQRKCQVYQEFDIIRCDAVLSLLCPG